LNRENVTSILPVSAVQMMNEKGRKRECVCVCVCALYTHSTYTAHVYKAVEERQRN